MPSSPERTKNLKAAGLCTRCGSNPLVNKTECIACRDRRRKYQEKYRQATNKRVREKQLEFESKGLCVRCGKTPPDMGKKSCRECLAVSAARVVRYKKKVFEGYGGAFCACCGEMTFEFLTLDHVKNDGAVHRKALKDEIGCDSGISLYKWIIESNYPEIFQVLCWNCNCGKKLNNGVCPHKLKTVL